MTNTWTFIGDFGGSTETYLYPADSNACIASVIEEQLYILWELDPAIRGWWSHMAKADGIMYTFFRYGATEMFTVRIDPKAQTVLVKAF